MAIAQTIRCLLFLALAAYSSGFMPSGPRVLSEMRNRPRVETATTAAPNCPAFRVPSSSDMMAAKNALTQLWYNYEGVLRNLTAQGVTDRSQVLAALTPALSRFCENGTVVFPLFGQVAVGLNAIANLAADVYLGGAVSEHHVFSWEWACVSKFRSIVYGGGANRITIWHNDEEAVRHPSDGASRFLGWKHVEMQRLSNTSREWCVDLLELYVIAITSIAEGLPLFTVVPGLYY